MLHFTRCPKCFAINLFEPGIPATSHPIPRNRCAGLALTGQPGWPWRGIFDGRSWAHPARHGSTRCGAALTDPRGAQILPIARAEFVEMTRSPFRPADILQRAMEQHWRLAVANKATPSPTDAPGGRATQQSPTGSA